MSKKLKNKVLHLLLALPILSMANFVKLQTFGQQLFYRLSISQPKENQLLSAFPLATLLILLRMNAENDTALEIENNFGLNDQPTDDIAVNYLALWDRFDQNQFVEMLNHIAIKINNEIVKDIDLDVQDTIQAWLYRDICNESYYLTSFGQEVQLVLSTEIHFQNTFRYNISYTLKRPFYASVFEIIEVEMLNHVANIQLGEIPQLNAIAFKVPYSGGDTSLVILFPNSLRSIMQLENNLKSFSLSSIDSYLSWDWVVLLFPKLEIVVERSLTDGLKNLGMSRMFQRLCDTSEVIKVADVNFRASFNINEKNSGLDPVDTDMTELSEFPKFEVNHPFIFFIQSSTNEIYLTGKFMK